MEEAEVAALEARAERVAAAAARISDALGGADVSSVLLPAIALIGGICLAGILIFKLKGILESLKGLREDDADRDGSEFRDLLGTRVVFWSMLALSAVAVFVVVSGFVTSNSLETNRWVFSSLLPLFGTWVGTVLAYYFSKENFKVASKASEDLFKISTQRLTETAAQDVMIPRASIIGALVGGGDWNSDALEDIPLAKIKTQFENQTLPGGRPISRLVILSSSGACLAILHNSTWSAMRNSVTDHNGASPAAQIDIATGTFGEVLPMQSNAVPGKTYRDYITGLIAVVGKNANLRQARDAMRRIEQCQDVIVTEDGTRGGALTGWITNDEIAAVLET